MTPCAALASLELRRAPRRRGGTRIAGAVSSGASSGSIGAAGLSTAAARDPQRLRARERGGSRAGTAARRGRRRPPRRRSRGPRRRPCRASMSPATPRLPRTSWQNPWVVAIVAASKSASARGEAVAARRAPRRRCRAASSATTSSPLRGGAAPASARAEPALDRDEPLADALAQLAGRHPGERHEQQRPAACPRRRSAPPARRSCTSCPCRRSPRAPSRPSAAGRRRRTARTRAHRSLTASCVEQRRPTAAARSAPNRVGSPRPSPRPPRRRAGGSREQLLERERAAEDELVLRLAVLAVEVASPTSTSLARRRHRRRLPRGGRGVGGRGRARERQRLAQPAVAQVGERRELLERAAASARRPARCARSSTVARSAVARARPMVTAASGRSVGGGERQQPHPRGEPVLGLDARVGDGAQRRRRRRRRPCPRGGDRRAARRRRRPSRGSEPSPHAARPAAAICPTIGRTSCDDAAARAGPAAACPRAISARDAPRPRPSRRAARRAAARRPPTSQPVELDRQDVVELVREVADADAQALAQERLHRVLRRSGRGRRARRPASACGGSGRRGTAAAARGRAAGRARRPA